MVNIKIDPKTLSDAIEKYLESQGIKSKIEARELPDGRLVLRRHYDHTIVSSVISYESTGATVGRVEEVGEDTVRVPGNFYLTLTGLLRETAKTRERKGV